jgi:putative endonuclease
MTTDRRRPLGALGERLAALHLERLGYTIVERNFRVTAGKDGPGGEIDLIAVDERFIVFCEVKTRIAGGRSGPPLPLDSIDWRKRRRLRTLAREWLTRREPGSERPARPELRFDAVGIVLSPAGRLLSLDHVEGAF